MVSVHMRSAMVRVCLRASAGFLCGRDDVVGEGLDVLRLNGASDARDERVACYMLLVLFALLWCVDVVGMRHLCGKRKVVW